MIQYISSSGETFDLLDFKTRLKDANFHNYAWEYDGIEQQYGVDITKFRKEAKEYDASVIFRGSINERKENLNHFLEASEKDIINKTPGKIIYEDYYIRAYVISSSTYPYDGADWTQKDVVFLCPYPFWIREETRSFLPVESTSSYNTEFLGYPYGYLYDYSAPDATDLIWVVNHFASCEFLMTIYGPEDNPLVTVNGHPYQVFAELETGEYMTIDSRENRVEKHLPDGTSINLYNYRSRQESIFEPVEPGSVRVMWSGEFGFDITLYLERSEPGWKTNGS